MNWRERERERASSKHFAHKMKRANLTQWFAKEREQIGDNTSKRKERENKESKERENKESRGKRKVRTVMTWLCFCFVCVKADGKEDRTPYSSRERRE